MQGIDSLNSGGAWIQIPTVTAFEEAYEGRVFSAILKDGDLWLFAADVAAILTAGNVEAVGRYTSPDALKTATFYTGGRRETLKVIGAFSIGCLIENSLPALARPIRRWLTNAFLPAAFCRGVCRIQIRGDGATRFHTGQIGQFDLTFGDGGCVYITRVLWRERTKRPTQLTVRCI
jgi:hypothetical protein